MPTHGSVKPGGIHVQEQCDTWLSTENAPKFMPRRPTKPRRYGVQKVFKPLNVSLLDFNFTQTKSFTATKQTQITKFFGKAECDKSVFSSQTDSAITSSESNSSELPHFISLQSDNTGDETTDTDTRNIFSTSISASKDSSKENKISCIGSLSQHSGVKQSCSLIQQASSTTSFNSIEEPEAQNQVNSSKKSRSESKLCETFSQNTNDSLSFSLRDDNCKKLNNKCMVNASLDLNSFDEFNDTLFDKITKMGKPQSFVHVQDVERGPVSGKLVQERMNNEITDSFWTLGSLDSCYGNGDSQIVEENNEEVDGNTLKKGVQRTFQNVRIASQSKRKERDFDSNLFSSCFDIEEEKKLSSKRRKANDGYSGVNELIDDNSSKTNMDSLFTLAI